MVKVSGDVSVLFAYPSAYLMAPDEVQDKLWTATLLTFVSSGGSDDFVLGSCGRRRGLGAHWGRDV